MCVVEVLALAASIGELTQHTRRARTAMWCALQMSSKDIPQFCAHLRPSERLAHALGITVTKDEPTPITTTTAQANPSPATTEVKGQEVKGQQVTTATAAAEKPEGVKGDNNNNTTQNKEQKA